MIFQKSPTHSVVARTASWSPNVQELGGSVNNGETPSAMVFLLNLGFSLFSIFIFCFGVFRKQSLVVRYVYIVPSLPRPSLLLFMEILLFVCCNMQRLKRMKDGMREMRQWCDLMIQEEEVTLHEENKIVKVY